MRGRILSTGYNGAPMGMPHCSHECDCDFVYRHAYYDAVDHRNFCRSLQPCHVSVHAELNAYAFAARHGVSTFGSELYTTDSPCLTCAQLVINAGTVLVDYQREYRVTDGLELLQSAGICLVHSPHDMMEA
jgi:dCMP deaminase